MEQTADAHGAGSSPRGRGKLDRAAGPGQVLGLIPARAGKTAPPERTHSCSTAHPRAGGENGDIVENTDPLLGSSPRGRGKQGTQAVEAELRGLIPARAGKTQPP